MTELRYSLTSRSVASLITFAATSSALSLVQEEIHFLTFSTLGADTLNSDNPSIDAVTAEDTDNDK